MKKLLAMLLTLALVLCPLALAEEGGAPYKVAFICKGYTDMFCLTVMEYVQEHAPEYADTFEVEYFDGEVNTETANTLIENCVTSGFDCIIFQQNDAVAPVEVVKRAVENGVYVIVTTGHIEDDGESYYVDANPYQQGELVMQYAIEQGIIKKAPRSPSPAASTATGTLTTASRPSTTTSRKSAPRCAPPRCATGPRTRP